MKKKNFSNLTDKQKEEEIVKLGTSLSISIPKDTPFGIVAGSLVAVLGVQIITRSKDPKEALETIIQALTSTVNKLSHEDDNDNNND